MNLILALILKMALMLRVVPHEPQIEIPKQPAIMFTAPQSGWYRVNGRMTGFVVWGKIGPNTSFQVKTKISPEDF